MTQQTSSNTTLLSLVSKQIWPQVLVVCSLRPKKLVLLHSSEPDESLEPAKRLKSFFVASGMLEESCVKPLQVPHDDMRKVERLCAEVRAGESRNSWVTHFTGGNKLMATGAFLDAIRSGVPACYLERGNALFWFRVENDHLVTSSEKLDGHIADELDPLQLLLCQMSNTELSGPGERLSLKGGLPAVSDGEFHRLIFSQARDLLQVQNPRPGTKPGDPLEYAVAATALRFGARTAYRSVGIRTAGVTRDQTDFDVLFNHGGKLWLVDCKDQRTHHSKFLVVRRCLDRNHGGYATAANTLGQLEHELEATPYVQLKQALLDIQRAGGLLGKIIVVRKSDPSPEVQSFAAGLGISLISKPNLFQRMKELLTAP